MGLSSIDLMEIRSVFKEELVKELEPIKGDLEALTNDIKEIYMMISKLQKATMPDKQFQKLASLIPSIVSARLNWLKEILKRLTRR
jgi:hypothetical protein